MTALRQLETDLWVAERPLQLWLGDIVTHGDVLERGGRAALTRAFAFL